MNEKDKSLFDSIIVHSAAGVEEDIKEGANVNARDLRHATPLHRASSQPLIVPRLLHHGADPNAIDDLGRTPLHASVGNPETYRYDRMEVMQLLLEAKADPNIADLRGTTPLHDAATIPRETATPVSLLLRAGADPMARDELGNTPLHYAARHPAQYRGHAVQYLLEAGADPNAQNRRGNTPLHMAISGPGEDQAKALSYLLRKGADLSLPNARGQTPLQLSAERGNPVAQNTIRREASARDRRAREASASAQPQQQEAQQMATNGSAKSPKGAMTKANEYYRDFADRIIEQMEKDKAPWQKPWKPGEGVPQSLSTGREYRGGNSLHLMAVAQEKGYSDPRWGTFDHIKYAGGSVRKGEKGTRVVWWDFSQTKRKVQVTDREGKPVLDDKGKPVERFQAPTSKVYTVFNVEQADGLKEKLPPLSQGKPAWDPHRTNEDLIKASKVKVRHVAGDQAYYNLKSDTVTLPRRAQFPDAASYYQTANHELSHATGHPSRMNRQSLQEGVSQGFKSEAYAREELRAEISAMMTNTRLGVGHRSKNGAAYVAAWSEVLKKNPREIYYASRDAQTISDRLIEPVRDRLRTQQQAQEQAKSPEKQATRAQSPAPEAAKEKTPSPAPATAKSKERRPKTTRTKATRSERQPGVGIPGTVTKPILTPEPAARPWAAKTRSPKPNGNSLAGRMKAYRNTIPKDHVEIKAQRPSGLPGGLVTYKYNGKALPADLEGLTQKQFGAKHIVAHAPKTQVEAHLRPLAARQADRKPVETAPAR